MTGGMPEKIARELQDTCHTLGQEGWGVKNWDELLPEQKALLTAAVEELLARGVFHAGPRSQWVDANTVQDSFGTPKTQSAGCAAHDGKHPVVTECLVVPPKQGSER